MNKQSNQRIGWINGKWGDINDLKISICDRGLNLGDGIFETILILQGQPILLTKHLNRWQKSAYLLGMKSPPQEKWLLPLINEGIQLASLCNCNGVIRLNWSRGNSTTRGINPPSNVLDNKHNFWVEINHYEPLFAPISTMISEHERRNTQTRLNQHKTFAYGQSIQARQEAQLQGFDEALLPSTSGEVCCSTTANLIIKRQHKLLTPRIESGCLPGIMRQQGLDSGLFKEKKLNILPEEGDQWLLINSLNCQPIYKINDKELDIFNDPETLWHELLNGKDI